ncbi:MAG: 6-phosphofructokinase [Candidatus Odinarchaeota archaeon]
MKKIGLITSGGDAPGMNAATRAVVRKALKLDYKVYGFIGGYDGVLKEEMVELSRRSVSNIVQTGGTIIKAGRSKEFLTVEGQKKAAKILTDHHFDAFIGNGGNGTMAGMNALSNSWDGQLIGLPGTIDNDIYGCDYSIGFDTAVNTALDAIDKIRDTAFSHDRAFIIEVMGRDSGFIALEVAVAGGCEDVLIPEIPANLEKVAERFKEGKKSGKSTDIIILAEGAAEHKGALFVSQRLKELTDIEWRTVVIGYIQRGGSPTARDRVLATKLGFHTVDVIAEGGTGVMVGEVNKQLTLTPFEEVYTKKKLIDKFLLEMIAIVQ